MDFFQFQQWITRPPCTDTHSALKDPTYKSYIDIPIEYLDHPHGPLAQHLHAPVIVVRNQSGKYIKR